jgi:hypothetical protein
VLHVDINTLIQHTSDEGEAKSSSDTESPTNSDDSTLMKKVIRKVLITKEAIAKNGNITILPQI